MDRWAGALLLTALAVVVAPFLPIYPYKPLAVTLAVTAFISVFLGWTFVLLRMSFATGRRSQLVAAGTLAIAWILMVGLGAEVVRQSYLPVHDDFCRVAADGRQDPRDPDCTSASDR